PDDPAERQLKFYQAVKAAAEALHDPKYGRDRFPELAENTTFPGWARESFALAREVAYQNGRLVGVPVSSDPPFSEHVEEVGEKYETAARELIRKRVALAGY